MNFYHSSRFFFAIGLLSKFITTSTSLNLETHCSFDSLFEKITNESTPTEYNQKYSCIAKFLIPTQKISGEKLLSFEKFKSYVILKFQAYFGHRKTRIFCFGEDCFQLKDISKEDNLRLKLKKLRNFTLEQQIFLFMNNLPRKKKENHDEKFCYDNLNSHSITSFEKNFKNISRKWYKFRGDFVQHYLIFDVDDFHIDEGKFFLKMHEIYSKACFYTKKSSILFYLGSNECEKIYNEVLQEFIKLEFENFFIFDFTVMNYLERSFALRNRQMKILSVTLTPIRINYRIFNNRNFDRGLSITHSFHSSMDILKKLTLVMNNYQYNLSLICNKVSLIIKFKVFNRQNNNLMFDYLLQIQAKTNIDNRTQISKKTKFTDIKDQKRTYECKYTQVYYDKIEYDMRFVKQFSKTGFEIKFIKMIVEILNRDNIDMEEMTFDKILKRMKSSKIF